MTPEVYKVAPDAPLKDVAAHMAQRGYGCAFVMEDRRPVGIFTSTDALRLLGEPAR